MKLENLEKVEGYKQVHVCFAVLLCICTCMYIFLGMLSFAYTLNYRLKDNLSYMMRYNPCYDVISCDVDGRLKA